MTLAYALLLFLHLLAAAFWVGGMATMHFAVRPAAVATLEPPQRLPLMAAALGRFFVGVNVAIVLLFVAGFGMVGLAGGFGAVGWPVHAMLTIAIVMAAIYGHIRMAAYTGLQRAIAERAWPMAAGRLNLIRQLVVVNLSLGVAVFAIAIVGRAVGH